MKTKQSEIQCSKLNSKIFETSLNAFTLIASEWQA